MLNKIKHFFLNINFKTVGVLVLLSAIAVIFWDTMLVYPVKLFVVILHEASHGLAAIVTGGRITKIEIDPRIGGVCYFEGGIPFITASAGYLGSIFWGGLILIIAARTKYDNIMGMVIGALLVLLSILYIRNLFGFIFTFFFGIFLFALSYKIVGYISNFFIKVFKIKNSINISNYVVDFIMKFLGLTSCLYVLIDIKEDLIDRSGIGSDADYIAQSLGWQGLSVPVGIFWLIIAFFAFLFFLLIASQKDSQERMRK